MDKSTILSTRLGFLHDAAHTLFTTHPSLSRFYMSTFSDVCAAENIPIVEKVAKRFCSRCGTLFVPGRNVTVRVLSEKGKEKGKVGAKRKRKEESTADGTVQNNKKRRIVINRLGDYDIPSVTRKPAASARFQSFTPNSSDTKNASKPSNPNTLLNHVSYLCAVCDAETIFPGTSAGQLKQYDDSVVASTSLTTAKVTTNTSTPSSNTTATSAAAGPSLDVPTKPPTTSTTQTKKKKKDKKKSDLRTLLSNAKNSDAPNNTLSLTDFLTTL